VKFHTIPLRDALLIELEKRADQRGFFARFFCQNEFRAAGLVSQYAQINNSFSGRKGTLRGLHYQLPPASEVKIVRCIRGALFDCIVDVRPDSPTFGKWFGTELSADNRLTIYVPRGFAHGTLTLSDDTEAFYLVSDSYSPQLERGIRWNDSLFQIAWPIAPSEISPKDETWPDFDPSSRDIEALRALR
jgi:dTDP-4-dehydrorhamnose 3,5-epimerase